MPEAGSGQERAHDTADPGANARDTGRQMIEVVVIGGGIVGCATALALSRRGAAVNLVERERPGAAATGASAGMLAPQYESAGPGPLYHLAVRARDEYDDFVSTVEELSGHSLHARRDGMLVANRTEAEHDVAEADARWQRELGHRAELLAPGAAAEVQGGLSTDVVSWLWLPDEGQVDTQVMVNALPAALAATDIRVVTGSRVDRVLQRQGAVIGVTLDDGRTLDADRVVLAAGAWSDRVEGLPRTVPVRPVRGQMLRFSAGSAALTPLVADHDGRYLVPRHDGTVLAGSTMEDAGYDRTVTDEGTVAIHDAVAGLAPALRDARPAERWADVRPISADNLPILGPDPELDGLFYATGHGRNGILLGPISGRITAALVMNEEPDADWAPFGIGRFG